MDNMKNIKNRISALKDDYKRDLVLKSLLSDEISKLENEISNSNVDTFEKTQIILQKLSEQQRKAACKEMEDLCTFALQYAISKDEVAEIEIGELRNKPAAQLYVTNTKTGIKTTPLSENGGGIVDIVSVALVYIIAEVWSNPSIDGPIILDEAYKHLSKEYIPLIADFVKKISEDFDRQTIMSTHNDFMSQSADNRIIVCLDDDGHSITKTTK